MIEQPDGVEVVSSAADAVRLDSPPFLVLESLLAYFDERGLGSGPLRWERIGDGQSNVTFEVQRDGFRAVLRRGPRPPLPPSAHDMLREAWIQQRLAGSEVAVPGVLAVCDDPAVLGVPFYVMELVEGEVVTDRMPVAPGPADGAAFAHAAIDALVRLHAVDPEEVGLSGLGRPDGYVMRQIDRFRGLWARMGARDLPGVDRVADELRRTAPVPQRSSIVHGDYRLGNLLFDRDDGWRIAAVLDWEMATLGDPLADLGYFTATYAQAGESPTVMELSSVTAGPGFPTRAELAALYGKTTGLDLDALAWYEALALWKSAVFCEAIHQRWLRGERPGDTFGPTLTEGVPDLVRASAVRLGL
jgi:aminoglycoside phosphotransferase (APT) family kinase protein